MEIKKVSYNVARSGIKNGDIIFIAASGFKLSAKVIEFVTRSKFYHVCIAFWVEVCGEPRLMIVESSGGAMRRIVNLSYYKEHEMHVVCSPRKWNTYSTQALSRLGTVPYGTLNFMYIGLREFLLRRTKYINLPRLNLPGEVCSEYVARMLNLSKKNVSPQIVYEQLMNTGHKIRFIKK